MMTGQVLSKTGSRLLVRLGDGSTVPANWISNSSPGQFVSVERQSNGLYLAEAKNAVQGGVVDSVIATDRANALTHGRADYDIDYTTGRVFNEDVGGGYRLELQVEAIAGAVWRLNGTVIPPEQLYTSQIRTVRRGERLTLRIDFEDSAECGGTNGNIQTGRVLIRSLSVFRVRPSVFGLVETENAGFDWFRLWTARRDNSVAPLVPGWLPSQLQLERQIFNAASTQTGGGCVMMRYDRRSFDSVIVSNKQMLVLHSSTGDGRWHKGAFWQTDLQAL